MCALLTQMREEQVPHLADVVPDVQKAGVGRHPDQAVHHLDEALDDGDVQLPARDQTQREAVTELS